MAGDSRRRGDGLPISTDPNAESTDPSLPAFLAPPAGAPPYHGFPILEGVEVDGFRLGVITAIGPGGDDAGDAFVIAPDGSRAGLVWEVGDRAAVIVESKFEEDRWGVWEVTLPHPMRTEEDARRNLAALLPELRERWEAWLAWRRAGGER